MGQEDKTRQFEGDKREEGISYIYGNYITILKPLAISLLRNDYDYVEDAIAITIARFWQREQQGAVDPTRAQRYLKGILRNVVFERIRSRPKHKPPPIGNLEHLPDESDECEEEKEILGMVSKGVDALPERFREIIKLRYYSNPPLDYQHIAEQLDITENHAYVLVYRAQIKLGNWLQTKYPEHFGEQE